MELRDLNDKLTMKPTNKFFFKSLPISRRKFVQSCTLGTITLASGSIQGCLTTKKVYGKSGPDNRVFPLDQDWLFGGKFNPSSLLPAFDDSAFSQITLPHCVTGLSWQDWNPEKWQDVWIYRRHFTLPRELNGLMNRPTMWNFTDRQNCLPEPLMTPGLPPAR